MINWNVEVESVLRRIRREYRLLDAVCDDISRALLVREITDDTRREMINPSPEITWSPLSESLIRDLEQWVQSTQVVVRNSKSIIEDFTARMQSFLSRQLLFLHLNKVLSISNDISSLNKESACVEGIYNKLEKWWPIYQSPQEEITWIQSQLPEIEDEGRSWSPRLLANQVKTIRREAIENLSQDGKKKLELKLELLEAFLDDLKHVKLENAIEKAWLEEMKDFLDDVHKNLGQRNKRLGLHRLLRKELDVGWMADGLTELLNAKNKFGFKFTTIQQQTHSHQDSEANDEDLILSLVKKIRAHLSNQTMNLFRGADPEITSLCNKLENMHTNLKAIDSASCFRLVCLNEMNNISLQLEMAFRNYMEETYPAKLVTSTIETRIKDLEIFIQAHNSKVRQIYSSIIGLEEDTDALISKLTGSTGSEECLFFSIEGVQGIGKSTLARKVYRHWMVPRHFPICKWVSVPNSFIDSDDLLENVGNQIITTNASQQEPEEGEIREDNSQKIKNFLRQERFLVVLDNVQVMEVWNVLREVFPETRNGSRILLTTRDRTVALQTESHKLRLRTKEESWEIFREKAQLSGELSSENEVLIRQAKSVVKSCWGLPSFISLFGTLTLWNPVDSESLWVAFYQAIQNQTLWSEALQISGLSDNLWSLLSYLILFPENCEIPARRLIALWVAEGLVQQTNNETDSLENIAEDCLLKLIGLNIIQPVERNVHGKLKTCCLPNPLRHILLSRSISSNQPRFPVDYAQNVGNFNLIHGANCDALTLHAWQNCKNIVSLISIIPTDNEHEGILSNPLNKGIAYGGFKKLKVLDLEHTFTPRLPKTIGQLIHLTYLGLRRTSLVKVPSTIGDLLDLQTLDLKHTSVRTLPSTIWNLPELRRLYLNQKCRSKFEPQRKVRSLQYMHTLWGVFLDGKNPLKDRLHELESLTKLQLSFQLSSPQQEELARGIAQLKNLQCLRLRSVGKMSEPGRLHLGDFSGLKNLSSMYLFGWLENELLSSKFPEGLSDLTLSASGLRCDPMPILEKLTNLKSLCLFADSCRGERMVCSTGGFPRLLVLKMWKLVHLADWTIEEGAMQNLKELEIRCCPLLSSPDGLRHLKTLHQLKLTKMSAEFNERCSMLVPLSIIDTKTLSN